MPILFDHFLVFSDFFQCRFWEFQGGIGKNWHESEKIGLPPTADRLPMQNADYLTQNHYTKPVIDGAPGPGQNSSPWPDPKGLNFPKMEIIQ